VELPDAAYSLYVQNSLEFVSDKIRLRYEALNRPAQVRQLELASGAQHVLKETPVLGVFNADDYVSQRLWATSADGTQVPISLVVRRDQLGKPVPLYLYGYGAYGQSLDPWFSHARLVCWTVAWPLPLRTYAAAANWAKPGTAPASKSTSKTPSATLSPAPNT